MATTSTRNDVLTSEFRLKGLKSGGRKWRPDAKATASCENPIPEPSVNKHPSHFASVKVVRESEVDLAGFIQQRHLLRGERHLDAGNVVLKLADLARTDDRNNRDRSISQPG
jgi:hypothetical protein